MRRLADHFIGRLHSMEDRRPSTAGHLQLSPRFFDIYKLERYRAEIWHFARDLGDALQLASGLGDRRHTDAHVELQQDEEDKEPRVAPLEACAETGDLDFSFRLRSVAG